MPDGLSQFLNPSEMNALSRLVLQSRYAVDGNLSGAHRSLQKGTSSEFSDHRQYIQGDDPKHIDWKVLGRTDRYFVRRYEDETNLRVYLVIDRSGSMGYASGDQTKYRFACRLAAALGYVVLKARDSVGLFLYADQIDRQMEAANSFAHLNNMMRVLQEVEPSSKTETASTLHRIAETVRRRAMIIVISDLLDDEATVVRALAHFRKQHHDVILFHVLDPAELDLTVAKAARFEDMETGDTVACDPQEIARAYHDHFAEFLDRYRQACREMKIDYRLALTNNPIGHFVRGYLSERLRQP